jgi:hypothetical protein
MKQLKRSECAILPLVLKGKWYDMIDSGEKEEEYRDYGVYWANRLHNFLCRSREKIAIVSFSKGYKKAGMFFRIEDISKAIGYIYPEWGEPTSQHYVIRLGERVELVD